MKTVFLMSMLVPDKYCWQATDHDGSVWVYQYKPIMNDDVWSEDQCTLNSARRITGATFNLVENWESTLKELK